MTNTTDRAREIASGLTKAQREAFARSNPDDMHPDWEGRISTYGDEAVGRELIALGLATPARGMAAMTFPFLTPLGEAVRSHIQGEEK